MAWAPAWLYISSVPPVFLQPEAPEAEECCHFCAIHTPESSQVPGTRCHAPRTPVVLLMTTYLTGWALAAITNIKSGWLKQHLFITVLETRSLRLGCP